MIYLNNFNFKRSIEYFIKMFVKNVCSFFCNYIVYFLKKIIKIKIDESQMYLTLFNV